MSIGFVVNNMFSEHPRSSTLKMGLTAFNRGHHIYFISVGDLSYDHDEKIRAKACCPAQKRYTSLDSFSRDLKDIPREGYRKIDVADLDVLMLRYDPSLEPPTRDWARFIALDFGMFAIKSGVIVLNNPGGLSKSRNKLYLQHFPEDIRPKTVITRDRNELKKFFDENQKVVLKPLFGSEGRNVFLVHEKEIPNVNQMIDAVSRDGYVIAQEYISSSEDGDIRLFVMNGEPLIHKGAYAAVKRVKTNGDLRNNIGAGGKAKKAKITKDVLRIVDIVRPRLVQDGMFLVGLDIAGDKLLEINVFMPGALNSVERITGVDFTEAIVDALERKVEYMTYYKRKFDNNEMATM
ncbi:glutathione synthase [Candidatus Pacearchaeota archaeon]|nr:glutathione synthase [Candidatus Pacearchaeota archaeon]MBD3283561.1 glutathione synthase [Candidatus Pacearchaeota archaeon]